MPSAYTQNLGLEKPATGEQAGTWGYTANNSYDFIDTSTDGNTTISLGTLNYSLDTGGAGSSNQGQVANGRSKLIIWTGGSSQLATVNIAPNTAQKLYAMRNATGSPLQFRQGTGAGIYTLQPGHDAWIYASGASSVGAVCDNPQFGNVLVTGSFAVGTDLHNAVLSVVDPAPTPPSLIYQSQASVLIDMGGAELAISAYSTIWFQARNFNSQPNTLMFNPAGGNVGIGLGTGPVSPQSTLDVGGNIRMSGGRSTLFYHGDAPAHVGGLQICGNVSGTDGIVAITPTDTLGNPWSTFIHLGGFGNWNNAIVGLAMQGNLGIGPVQVPAEPLVIYAPPNQYGQLRIAYGQCGMIFRNDSSNFYLMSTLINDPLGPWVQTPGVAPWALQIHLGTNAVGVCGGYADGYALNVNGSCSVTGNINMGGTVNCAGYLLYGVPLVMGVTSFASVTGSRSIGPTYQNTTGKPMWVSISVYVASAPASIVAYCDSGNPPNTPVDQTGTDSAAVSFLHFALSFIVLPGWRYRLALGAGQNGSVATWSEWW